MYRRWIGAALALLLLLGAAGSVLALERLCVHYIDVGQGEAAFLAGPDFAVLIDAGDLDGTEVLDYLKALGVETIDLFVVTHPHADHIGQAAQVMRSFTVREVWMSGYEHYTRIFEELLDEVLESDADYFEPRRGDQRQLGGLTLQVLNPMEPTGSIHESCLVLRAVYGQVAFLFTGDAERRIEEDLVRRGLPLQAQILQLGHHGSRTSSSLDFLLAVDPEAAIYAAGRDNEYGHPHGEVLNRLKILEIPVYGTDELGTIVVCTDGFTYELAAGREPPVGGERAVKDCVDLNTASFQELQRIIHIGEGRARQIIEERARRPFRSVDELRWRIDGIGDKRLADIKAQGLACVKGVTED